MAAPVAIPRDYYGQAGQTLRSGDTPFFRGGRGFFEVTGFAGAIVAQANHIAAGQVGAFDIQGNAGALVQAGSSYVAQAQTGAFNMLGNAATLTLVGWSAIPDHEFERGVASNYDIAPYLIDPLGLVTSITEATGTLPTGVTFSSANRRFEYDGTDTGSDILLTGISLDWHTSRMVNGLDTVLDFQTRIAAPGVQNYTNFSQHSTTQELIASAAFQGNGTTRNILTEDPKFTLSGKACLMERLPTDGTTAGGYALWFGPGDTQVGYDIVYVHFSSFSEADDLDWIQDLEDPANPGQSDPGQFNWTPKLIIIDWFNGTAPNFSTECVIDMLYKQGFASAYCLGGPGGGGFYYFDEGVATPYGADSERLPAVDNLLPANPQTLEEWNERYGLTDNAPGPTKQAGDRLSTQGFPYAPAALNGAGLIHPENHTSITVKLDYPNDQFSMWVSKHADPPVKTHDNHPALFNSRLPTEHWDHGTVTCYMTNGLPELLRPIMRRACSEIIISTQPPNHPGGFALT